VSRQFDSTMIGSPRPLQHLERFMTTTVGILWAMTLAVVLTVGCHSSSAPTAPSAAGPSTGQPGAPFNVTGLVARSTTAPDP
jgi:hypothetical protein